MRVKGFNPQDSVERTEDRVGLDDEALNSFARAMQGQLLESAALMMCRKTNALKFHYMYRS